ncbi:glycosyltransferase [Escherichia coli STEC_94C]|nr:glycosyltransferase [Escherichia coli STEC_94C]
MRVFISVVSHGHGELIESLRCLEKLSEKFSVVLKDNKNESNLKEYCKHNNIIYLSSDIPKGFGENNNIIFNYCISELKMQSDDIFIIMNPDVIVEENELIKLKNKMICENIEFATINLYKDRDYKIYDPSIRNYPGILDFVSGYLGFSNKTIINKSSINSNTTVAWAAGSFLALKSYIYKEVGGFDIRYFMYCEDIDICMRINSYGYKLVYIPTIKAIHIARHNNRRFLSKHFYWHLRSALIYLSEKRKYVSKKISTTISKVIGGNALAQIIVILGTPLLTRIYQPSDFGIYSTIMAVVLILGVIACGRYDQIMYNFDDKYSWYICFCNGLVIAICISLLCLIATGALFYFLNLI